MIPPEMHKRVFVDHVAPELDCGRFSVKRIAGEHLTVQADVFTDGHDRVGATLLYRKSSEEGWRESKMEPTGSDRFQGAFPLGEPGTYLYRVKGWLDHFGTWKQDLRKRVDAGQNVAVDLLIGAEYLDQAAGRAEGPDKERLEQYSERLKNPDDPLGAVSAALGPELGSLMSRWGDHGGSEGLGKELRVVVDRKRALFSTWYELFPRSLSPVGGQHGTFQDCLARIPELAGLGFDVLYLPPIHPIGITHRKGKNNHPRAMPEDPGSPWAIGGPEGGHKAIHPELGTLEDFKRLVEKAHSEGMEIALDLAFQCSPDHPYVKEHPEWFRRRPDGTIQYAENPPKKYEDIFPFDFETRDWIALWDELKSVVLFWIEQGVRIFRVDNPHTKPFRFWEWLIGEVKKETPEVLFLAEAFTRPKVMYHLAKLGFTQSYTYFSWRNTQWELTEYFTELTQSGVEEYFRPNLWPNTPDILTEYLQMGGRAAFMIRLILAATLGSNYGIYGPAFELMENRPREFGSEEYFGSEKYEIKEWDVKRPDSLRGLLSRINQIRRDNPALQGMGNLQFFPVDNEQLLCYGKSTQDLSNGLLVVINLDPHHTHGGWVTIPTEDYGVDRKQSYQMHDLLSDSRYLWMGPRNYIRLDPKVMPAHIFRLRRRVRTERDFDYFM